jgi:fatty acid-binding protein DegV
MNNSDLCLIVDASCDLPYETLAHPQVRTLPVPVVVGGDNILDRREVDVINTFYKTALSQPEAAGGYSEPPAVNDMIEAFNRVVAPQFDHAFGVFVSGSRSPIYSRAKTAMQRARVESYPPRLKAGKSTPIAMDCADSKALFAGYAVQVMDLLDELAAGASLTTLAARQAFTVDHTYAYMVPGNVEYILRRASLKGEESVSGLAAFAAKQFSITPIIRGFKGDTEPVARKFGRAKAQQALFTFAQNMMRREKLLASHLCFSYSGDLSDITSQAGYQELLGVAERRGIRVHLTHMSITGSVNVGPGALVVGFIAKEHDLASMT